MDKIAKRRYDSLVDRSFKLHLRYKLFAELKCENKDKVDFSEVSKISNDIKIAFKKLYKPNARKELLKINNCYKNYITPDEIKKNIKEYKEKYLEVFKNELSKKEFSDFWNNTIRSCGYCGLSEKQITSLEKDNKIETKRLYSRGRSMEVDQKDPNAGYKEDNIIMSCYWCNNAKTDEFSPCDFKEVARAFNNIWSKRLVENISFPEATYKKCEKQT